MFKETVIGLQSLIVFIDGYQVQSLVINCIGTTIQFSCMLGEEVGGLDSRLLNSGKQLPKKTEG